MTTLTLVTVNGCLGMKREVGVLDNTNLSAFSLAYAISGPLILFY